MDSWEVGFGEGFGDEASKGVGDCDGPHSILLFGNSN